MQIQRAMILFALLTLSMTACVPQAPSPEPSPTVFAGGVQPMGVSTPTEPGWPTTESRDLLLREYLHALG